MWGIVGQGLGFDFECAKKLLESFEHCSDVQRSFYGVHVQDEFL